MRIGEADHNNMNTKRAPDVLDERMEMLRSTLEEVVKVQQRLVGVLQQEKSLVIAGELDRLMVCLAEKEATLEALRRLEAQWRAHIKPIAGLMGFHAEGLSLSRLIESIGEPHQSRLRSCQQRLSALKASILEINQVNGFLIEKTLKKIGDLIQLLRHLSSETPTYRPTGLLSPSSPQGRLLCKG